LLVIIYFVAGYCLLIIIIVIASYLLLDILY